MIAAITQSDIATAYGWGLDALWDGLLSGKTAIRSTQRFAERGFVSDQAAEIADLKPEAGESRVWAGLRRILLPLAGKLDPQTPVILATTVGEIEFVERAVLEEKPALAENSRPGVLVERVKELLGLRGTGIALSSACASSAAAITQAAAMVQDGEAKSVLVVTGDAVSEFVYSGFSSLLSLCPTPAQPFDRERSGLTLGEAFGWAIVSGEETDDAADDAIGILGWGNTTDAVHMTAPDRNAGGLSRAISKSLRMSGLAAEDVAFVAAHGTGTIYSDAMEMTAFKAAMDRVKPVFSVKGGVGHTLSAAGLAQILVTGRGLARGKVPPTIGLRETDDAAAGWAANRAIDLDAAKVALSTNSGFGGVNTAIVLGGGRR
jgi:3-oxoacyl-(acyl-carrier-protein) synthase